MTEPTCCGICVMGYEVLPGAPAGSVAYIYPGCELHDPCPWDENTEDAEKFEPLPPEERSLPRNEHQMFSDTFCTSFRVDL